MFLTLDAMEVLGTVLKKRQNCDRGTFLTHAEKLKHQLHLNDAESKIHI